MINENPINDIFEGIGDLLLKHGEVEFTSYDLDGNLKMINRTEKEDGNGKN